MTIKIKRFRRAIAVLYPWDRNRIFGPIYHISYLSHPLYCPISGDTQRPLETIHFLLRFSPNSWISITAAVMRSQFIFPETEPGSSLFTIRYLLYLMEPLDMTYWPINHPRFRGDRILAQPENGSTLSTGISRSRLTPRSPKNPLFAPTKIPSERVEDSACAVPGRALLSLLRAVSTMLTVSSRPSLSLPPLPRVVSITAQGRPRRSGFHRASSIL